MRAFGILKSAAFFIFLLIAATSSRAGAAEIKLLGPFSLRALLPEPLPQFEKSSGHKVRVGYDTPGAIAKRLVAGEAADVAIVSPKLNEDLHQFAFLLMASRVEIAKADGCCRSEVCRPIRGIISCHLPACCLGPYVGAESEMTIDDPFVERVKPLHAESNARSKFNRTGLRTKLLLSTSSRPQTVT
jgi:hypothetical protein